MRWTEKGLVAASRDADLAGQNTQILVAPDFLDEVGIAFGQKVHAVGQAPAMVIDQGQRSPLGGELLAGIAERDQSARTGNGEVAEVADRRQTNGGEDQRRHRSRNASPDSHALNESRLIRDGQEIFR
jgi:hypothetical protein